MSEKVQQGSPVFRKRRKEGGGGRGGGNPGTPAVKRLKLGEDGGGSEEEGSLDLVARGLEEWSGGVEGQQQESVLASGGLQSLVADFDSEWSGSEFLGPGQAPQGSQAGPGDARTAQAGPSDGKYAQAGLSDVKYAQAEPSDERSDRAGPSYAWSAHSRPSEANRAAQAGPSEA